MSPMGIPDRSVDLSPGRKDLICFDVAAAGAMVLTLVTEVETPGVLPAFGDSIDPLELVPVAVAGRIALRSLWRRGLAAADPRPTHWFGEVVGGGAVLAGVAIAVDVLRPFSRDTNVSWPGAFATYPVMAFMAESLLYLVPLAVVSAVAGGKTPRRRATAVVSVAALEAVFQVVASPVNRWFVGPHLFVIGLFQLRLLRRHGFGAMLLFRLVYYLIWHVVWGRIRLDALF